MSQEVRALEPKVVWNFFEDLNEVPRPSKKEEQVIAFMRGFALDRGLEVVVDKVGNVVVKKPATPGMENRKSVVMQSHLDMVHQKNNDTDFDFSKEGIRSFIDGEVVTAEGTTLGADNGMGVAAIMAVLDSKDIAHPDITALFTIDEETGMTGAFELEGENVKGDILLNLDTEMDDEFSVGCAGGIDTNIDWKYSQVSNSSNAFVKIDVKGLKGGHSGMDIHKGLGNANKILGRFLDLLSVYDAQLVSFDGGSLRNAIPREGSLVVGVNDLKEAVDSLNHLAEIIKAELSLADPLLEIFITEVNSSEESMSATDTSKFSKALMATVNGVYRMSDAIPGLVETSSSLARVIVENGSAVLQGLQRSSIESGKMEVAHAFAAPYHLLGAEVVHSGSYPGWNPNPDSEILSVMKKLYSKNFGHEVRVKACHAGLECGILGEHFPEMDMISFGPEINFPHSPDEHVKIKSVQKFWTLLLDTLENIPQQ